MPNPPRLRRRRLPASPIRATVPQLVDDAASRPRSRSARAMPSPRSPKASACRCRCARARSRTSSATATSRSASRSTSASGAATRAPRTSRAAALEQTVRAAHDIARFTAEDPAAGLPDEADLADAAAAGATSICSIPGPSTRRRRSSSRGRCEAAALAVDRRITNSEGAGVSAQQSHFCAGNSRGFRGGYASSRHSLSVAPIASRRQGRRRHAARRLVHVDARARASSPRPRPSAATPASARCRASASRKIATCEVPVLFESALAAGLLGAYVQATSGGALYRKSTLPARQPRQARCCPSTSTSARTRTCGAARAARRSTTKASRPRPRAGRRRRRRGRAISCRPTRRASSACERPATPAARTT